MKPYRPAQARDFDLRKTLIAFDFDGTLGPIVENPAHARTSPELIPLVRQLKEKGATIAIVTGRARGDVRRLLNFKPDFIVGNHGMEGLPRFHDQAVRARQVCRVWVRELKKIWPDDRDITLENKVESLSFHYRGARRPTIARQKLKKILAGLRPRPRVIGGKFLFNVVPIGSPHKGKAIKELMRITGRRQAIFIGDDLTDEDGFREKGRIWSVRIGKVRGSAADVYIKKQSDLAELLRDLVSSST